jgi:hypothetical protein
LAVFDFVVSSKLGMDLIGPFLSLPTTSLGGSFLNSNGYPDTHLHLDPEQCSEARHR